MEEEWQLECEIKMLEAQLIIKKSELNTCKQIRILNEIIASLTKQIGEDIKEH